MEQLTKLEETAITQIAKDLRRTAKQLTDIPWRIHEEQIKSGLKKSSIRSYQKENLENVINEVKGILKYMNELQDVLNK